MKTKNIIIPTVNQLTREEDFFRVRPEAYSDPSQTSKTDLFAKIDNGWKLYSWEAPP